MFSLNEKEEPVCEGGCQKIGISCQQT